VSNTPADYLRAIPVEVDEVVGRRLIRNADASGEVRKSRSTQPILASCDVESFALLEPRTECMLGRPPDHLLIAARIADHLP
jgi:hypothetical protein